ncbi:hypothetical protein R69608_07018 [Paraburkholderia nemoris]|uniref:metallophosphoesterase n=1 Tax=Paraburkholderia nemoris TaxID=2793076 RepID=UPI001911EC54|nr:metallophosphoesterase [Paraburkholderia nemoris]MBK5152471.1 metallophosphoesterase [Burkholderia sp. R-69608]CAE6967541.1 hypothetical protein R69608_07018 [Paraburkholderia nemoris]
MIRLQIASDLHHEMPSTDLSLVKGLRLASDVDALVLAGDIHEGARAIDLYEDYPVPVIYVHGNHEALGQSYPGIVDEMRACARGTSVHVLQEDEWIYRGVRFLGACMWTDYFGFPLNLGDALDAAKKGGRDHRKVRRSDGRFFQPEDALGHQRRTLQWLNERLEEPFDGPTVVVTHHAPRVLSIPQRNRTHELAPAYASNVELLVLKVTLWVHGHLHQS